MKKNIVIPLLGILCIVLGVSLLVFVSCSSANTVVDTSEPDTQESSVSSNSSESKNDQLLLTTESQNQNLSSETVAEDALKPEEPEIKEEIQSAEESQTAESSVPQTDSAASNNNVEQAENNDPEVTENNDVSEEASLTKSTSAESSVSSESNEETQNSEAEPLFEDEPQDETAYFDGTTKVDTSLWNLILVNPDHFLPDGFVIDKMQVQGNYYLDSRVAPYAIQMIADAKKEGIDLQICSSIRDIDLQTRLFNNKINDLIDEGYSKEEAPIVAATIVAVPGTSEHHTGLAMDIVTPSYQRLNSGYAKTDAAKWLKANAAKYGFILRYPEDKTEITKIIFEPWHYRYVGVEYASFIMSEGICFEEFIEQYGDQNQ
jgi:D-alanyl-D-alanine carboxypeptidase